MMTLRPPTQPNFKEIRAASQELRRLSAMPRS
jgi:hypothetical protein